LLLTVLLLSSSIFFFAAPAKAQEEVATMKIINPLSGDDKFSFNATDYPVNSTFTADFYISSVTESGIVGWQIYVSWNNSVINYQSRLQQDEVPEDNNVFSPALAGGRSLIVARSLELDGDTAYLKYGVTVAPLAPVDVSEQALLCELTFKVAASPQDSQIFTNVVLISQVAQGTPLSTYVAFLDRRTSTVTLKPVFVGSSIVRITKSGFVAIHDVAIASLALGSRQVEVGDGVSISAIFQNLGNDLDTFNVTIENGQSIVQTFSQTLGAYENTTYQYVWDTSGLRLDIPQNVTIFGASVVVAYQAKPTITVILTLPGDNNLTNNQASVTLTVTSKLTGLDYLRWLFLVWVSSTLGELIVIYTVLFVMFLVAVSVYRRLTSPKPPSPPTKQKVKKPGTA
jgi:hypothetical protein